MSLASLKFYFIKMHKNRHHIVILKGIIRVMTLYVFLIKHSLIMPKHCFRFLCLQ